MAVTIVAAVTVMAEAERADRKTRATAASQARIETTLRTMWRAQRKGTIAALTRLRTRFPEFQEGHHLAEAVDPDDLNDPFDQVAGNTSGPLVRRLDLELPRAVEAGGGSAHLDLSIEGAFDVGHPDAGHPDAVSWLDGRGADRVAQINDTTRARMRTILSNAADEGWSWQRTARQIEQTFQGFSTPASQSYLRTRAELVAVTELALAYEEGARIVREGLVKQGLAVEVSWLTVGDDRVDPHCLANAGVGWIPSTESFPSGASAPPDHPGCRCSSMSRVAPEEANK